MESFKHNDEYLFEEIKKGNKKAFTFLYNNYFESLCTYVFSLTKNRKKAEDIVQDSMFIIWENRSKIQSKLSVKNYIYKIAYHQFINTYRKNKEHLNFVDEVKKSALDYFIEKDDDFLNNRKRIILDEIQKLPPKCREVFLLNKKSGLKYKEVAEELNISVKTVEIHISKALKRLRNKLNE